MRLSQTACLLKPCDSFTKFNQLFYGAWCAKKSYVSNSKHFLGWTEGIRHASGIRLQSTFSKRNTLGRTLSVCLRLMSVL